MLCFNAWLKWCCASACPQEELSFNPFLRISQPDIIAYSAAGSDPVQVLAALRKKKDGF